jgi:hypothetical protein
VCVGECLFRWLGLVLGITLCRDKSRVGSLADAGSDCVLDYLTI